MNNEDMNSRLKEFVGYLRSDEFRIKTISTCCVIMSALLVIIAGILYNIYQGIIAVTDLLDDGEYNRVVKIFNDEKGPEDVLPILAETSSTEATDKAEGSDSVTNHSKTNTSDINNKESSTTTTNGHTQSNDANKPSTDENNQTTTTTTPTKVTVYVININSKKIHKEDCSFVERMLEENKQTVQLTNSELNNYINDGYTICSSCGG